MDWAWGVDLADGRRRLVPAEVGSISTTIGSSATSGRPREPRPRTTALLHGVLQCCALGSRSRRQRCMRCSRWPSETPSSSRGTAPPPPGVAGRGAARPGHPRAARPDAFARLQVHFLVSTSDIDAGRLGLPSHATARSPPASARQAREQTRCPRPQRSARGGPAGDHAAGLDPQDVLPMLEDPWLVREWSTTSSCTPRRRCCPGPRPSSAVPGHAGGGVSRLPDALRPSTGGILGTCGDAGPLRQGRTRRDRPGRPVRRSTGTWHPRRQAVVPGTIPMVSDEPTSGWWAFPA